MLLGKRSRYQFQQIRYNHTVTISTKLLIPPIRDNVIPRSRLTEIVLSGLSEKFTLVSAPAGFGKTTLLSECTKHFNRPVTWVSLDDDDNDQTRFLNYFISSLGEIFCGFGESIQNSRQSNYTSNEELIISGLINEIVEIQKPFVLIMDDYHVITNPKIHEFLTIIIENQPPEMHLIISTRSDPPIALARWRVRQEMVEIRSQDLRFSLDETKSFLNDIMQLNLSEDAVSKLESKTEGWIAGLLMAAISLKGREDVTNFIQAFEGSHRFIFDYLVEEVLDQISSEHQEFLIRTSILDKLCAPLCNSLLNIQNSQSSLHKLDSMNLFIVPLDDKRYWYRYHHLFLDILSSRQVEITASEIEELHTRASIWYENNGDLLTAIDHAHKSGNIERVAQLIETNVLRILDRGELRGLIQLLNQLPESSLKKYPWLRIALAWALTQVGSLDDALLHLISTEKTIKSNSKDQNRHIAGHISAMRSYIELFSPGDHTQGAKFAKSALEQLPESDLRTRGMVYVTLGTMQRANQEPSIALETLQSALEIYQTRNQPYIMIDILSQMARAYREQGLLRETVRSCDAALEIASRYSNGKMSQFPNIAYTMGVLGRIYYEWNQLDKATEFGLQGLAISERWGQANTILGMYLLLARIYRIQCKFQDALEAIKAAKSVGSQFSDTHKFVIQTHEMSIRLAMGEFDSVENWVKIDSKNFETDLDEKLWELASLIVALPDSSQGNLLNELLEGLDRLSNISLKSEILRRSIKVDIQKAVIYHLQKNYDQSIAMIENALSVGKDDGYVRSFIDHGQTMEDILKKAIRAGIEVDYANTLLSTMNTDLLKNGTQPKIQESSDYIEPLTDREIEVLRILSTELSVPEIADELVITVGTLRTHIKRIYSKLDAHSRFEAVSKAKDFKILN